MSRIIVRGINSLKTYALGITGPIKITFSDGTNTVFGIFNPAEDLSEVDHCYNESDGVIAFIDRDTMYAIPSCRKVIKILKYNGFKHDLYMKVPFILGGIPKEKTQQEKWFSLKEWQKIQFKKEEKEDEAFSKKMGFRCRMSV